MKKPQIILTLCLSMSLAAPILATCFTAQPSGCYGIARACHPDAVRATTVEASNGSSVTIYDANGNRIETVTYQCGANTGEGRPGGTDGPCNPDLIGTAGWFAYCDPWKY